MAKKLKYNFLSLPSLAGHDDYQSTPGTPDLSITRATLATMVDADGYIREVQSGEARFTGATYKNNLIQKSDAADADYGTQGGTPGVSDAVITPPSGYSNVVLIDGETSLAFAYQPGGAVAQSGTRKDWWISGYVQLEVGGVPTAANSAASGDFYTNVGGDNASVSRTVEAVTGTDWYWFKAKHTNASALVSGLTTVQAFI
jgi:hypothetical protein